MPSRTQNNPERSPEKTVSSPLKPKKLHPQTAFLAASPHFSHSQMDFLTVYCKLSTFERFSSEKAFIPAKNSHNPSQTSTEKATRNVPPLNKAGSNQKNHSKHA
jgi:hypothetical protein